jgi:hypothetical protein
LPFTIFFIFLYFFYFMILIIFILFICLFLFFILILFYLFYLYLYFIIYYLSLPLLFFLSCRSLSLTTVPRSNTRVFNFINCTGDVVESSIRANRHFRSRKVVRDCSRNTQNGNIHNWVAATSLVIYFRKRKKRKRKGKNEDITTNNNFV